MSDLIDRQAAIDEIDEWIKAFLENGHKESAADACLIQDGIIQLPSAQPEIIRCKDCKYRMPYEWMFSETWRSISIDDYSEDEIGCKYCEMTMKADDFCSRADRRTDEQT